MSSFSDCFPYDSVIELHTFERDYDESPVETSMLLRVYFNRARLSVPPQISEH